MISKNEKFADLQANPDAIFLWTPAALELLNCAAAEGKTASGLHRETGMTLSYIFKILNKMRQAKLIKLHIIGANKRQKVISLTAKGKLCANAIKVLFAAEKFV